jgi:fatty acid desaturase
MPAGSAPNRVTGAGRARLEWPTVAVAAAIAGGFTAVLTLAPRLPLVVEVVSLAVLAAWYSSLQHEVIHGHPTPWPRLNQALAVIPLTLVAPYDTYRVTHLAHHRRDSQLTVPGVDPESFLVSPARWAATGPAVRGLLWVLQTVPGRLMLGPPLMAAHLWAGHRALHGRAAPGVALRHGLGVAGVLAVVAASGLPVAVYVLSTVWAGGALTLLRSFAEHRPVADGSRSAVVRSGRFFSLLYLNNNLHHAHHMRPGMPWYQLPALATDLGSDASARSGAGWYRGYGSVVRQYWRRPLTAPVYRSDVAL